MQPGAHYGLHHSHQGHDHHHHHEHLHNQLAHHHGHHGHHQQQADDVSAAGEERFWKRLTVSICTFNVLCQIYEPSHLPGNQCSFHVRCNQILSQIGWANADIVCLQEVNPVSWYRRMFSEQYDILFVSKSDSGGVHNHSSDRGNTRPWADGATPITTAAGGGGVGGGGGGGAASSSPSPHTVGSQPLHGARALSEHEMRHNINDADDGAAIMLKRGAVDLISCTHVLLLDPVDGGESGTLAPGAHRARQFGMVAHVLHIASKRTMFICAVHMKADMEDDAKRICHAKQLFQRIAQIRAADPTAPLFFAGDLNASPESPTMQLLTAGRAEYRGVVHLLGRSGMTSAMKHINDGQEPEFTILDSSHGGVAWWAVLDYILFERDKATPIAYLTPPSLSRYGGDAIPHSGSDHVIQVIEFFLHAPS